MSSGPSALDFTIMSPEGAYLAYSAIDSSTTRKSSVLVMGGVFYEVRVDSYYGAHTIDLKAHIRP
jgi:hypothetical protein